MTALRKPTADDFVALTAFDARVFGSGEYSEADREAVRAVLDLAFHQLRLHRVSASVDADNLASLALLERLGLRREAHFRRSEWFKGAWVDDIVHAVLRDEWLARTIP